jgi:hypothetical protein
VRGQRPGGETIASASDETRRMAPVYAAVIVVEVITLLGLWWFQRAFGS